MVTNCSRAPHTQNYADRHLKYTSMECLELPSFSRTTKPIRGIVISRGQQIDIAHAIGKWIREWNTNRIFNTCGNSRISSLSLTVYIKRLLLMDIFVTIRRYLPIRRCGINTFVWKLFYFAFLIRTIIYVRILPCFPIPLNHSHFANKDMCET